MSDSFPKDGSPIKLTLNTGTGGAGGVEAPPSVRVAMTGESGAQVVSVPGATQNVSPTEASYTPGKDREKRMIRLDVGLGKGEQVFEFTVDHR